MQTGARLRLLPRGARPEPPSSLTEGTVQPPARGMVAQPADWPRCRAHGDATPGNYLFDGSTCAIDFEGARDHAHPVRDLGILAAEIKASPGSNARAEDYIGHLLWHYSHSVEEFRRHIAVLPFFMALGHLRIARLPWRAAERDRLLSEAEACLAAIHR
ncbi:MAG: aminoglycoside phosphotransferase family protein [Methanoculleus sp.]|nr:aminoglycoside phosphotransferase family protein [Methanoculleus sp.]